MQNKDVQFVNGELKNDLRTNLIMYKQNGGIQTGSFQLVQEKEKNIPKKIEGRTTKDGTDGFAYWSGSDGKKYREEGGDYSDEDKDEYNYTTDDILTSYSKDNTILTLTAAYKVHLKYDANGGNGAPATKYGIDHGGGAEFRISSETPSRIGYEFLGWSKDKNSDVVNYKPGEIAKIEKNTTLYAVWIKSIKISKIEWKTNKQNEADAINIDPIKGHTAYNPDGSKIATIKMNAEGTNITMTGNRKKDGKNAIWTNLTTTAESETIRAIQSMSFTIRMNGFERDEGNDSFSSAGVLIGIKESIDSAGKVKELDGGYLISIATTNNSNYRWSGDTGEINVYKLKYNMNNYSANRTGGKEIADGSKLSETNMKIEAGKRYKFNVTLDNNGFKILVYCEDDKKDIGTIEINDSSLNKRSFGFYSTHFSHNCTNEGKFEIENIDVKVFVEE